MNKKYYLTLLILFSVCFGFAQTKDSLSVEEQQRREKNIQAGNPFKEFGYKPKIATLSKGKYLEFHDLDSIVKIGSFTFHVKNKTITGYILEEAEYSEATLRPEIVSRWFSPDPLSDEFPSWSPYNFVYNNPIRFVDPLGLAPESIHLDKYGNVLKNVDDGDDGVYVHNNATTEADVDKTYSAKNTSADGNKIGEIGGEIDANSIYSNTLRKNINEAGGLWNPFTFKNYVKTSGKWDLKNNKNTIYGLANDGKTQFSFNGNLMESQDIGNHHFGAVSLAYGLFPSENFILKEAGAYQIKSGTSKPEWQIFKVVNKTNFTKTGKLYYTTERVVQPPFGDDPRDQKWIKSGFQYFKKNN